MRRFIVLMCASWLAGGCGDDDLPDCPADRTPYVPTGEIIQGEVAAGAPVTFPLEVVVAIKPRRVIESVTIGGQPARLTDNPQGMQLWKATLFAVDLERNVAPGAVQAVLDVVVTDLCGDETIVDQATYALESVPGTIVDGLTTTWVKSFPEQCAVRSDGLAPAQILVTASLGSTGGVVTLNASQGLFANGEAKQDVSLRAVTGDPGHAEGSTFFKPSAAGTAVITASARGDVADPLVLLVVDAPSALGPTTPMRREVAYTGSFTTFGNFDECVVEEVVAGVATVTFIEPSVAVVNGVAPVAITPIACGSIERVRASVTFSATAPNGSAVTLRCFDGDGRFAAHTFSVETPPEPEPPEAQDAS